MPRRTPLPPSPRNTIKVRGRERKLGESLLVRATITRIGDIREVPSITVQLPDGSKLTLPAVSEAFEEK